MFTVREMFSIALLMTCVACSYKRTDVNDKLVLIRPSDIFSVLAECNSFDRNLNFTVDTFPDGLIHFLDIKASVGGTDIYREKTHTGQYTLFSSFEPFPRKAAWVKSYFHCAFMICSNKMECLSYQHKKFSNS